MAVFVVEMEGTAREVFHIEADSEEAARAIATSATGELLPDVMENSGMTITSVREDR